MILGDLQLLVTICILPFFFVSDLVFERLCVSCYAEAMCFFSFSDVAQEHVRL
jgi:hypothetical protein